MIPGLEMLACQDLAVPVEVMRHVVNVESSFNPYAIGVVGARLARQPRSLEEAVATATQLERQGYNFSLGLAQVNRHNLAAQGLDHYGKAFAVCPNLAAGARILADCRSRAQGDWDKALSCYYSGNFERGFRDGYVQKVRASMQAAGLELDGVTFALPVIATGARDNPGTPVASLRERRGRMPDPPAAEPTGDAQGPGREPGPETLRGPAWSAPDGPFVPRVTRPAGSSDLSEPPRRPGLDQIDSAFVF